ncbi:hypothetical protein [Embleya sp. NPDC050493]|uniref:hypothetical protein n=1 Tax=Embleya sp. NPDC050493 TaxID=3363989 RepID=UPI00378EEE16
MPRGRHRSVSTATRISLLAAICAPALVAVVLAVVAGGATTLRLAVLLGVSSAAGAIAWVVRGSTAHHRRMAEESIARRRERERMADELRAAIERADEQELAAVQAGELAAAHLVSRPQRLTPDLFARGAAVLDLLDRRGGEVRPTAPSIVPAVRRPPVSAPDLVPAYAASVFGPPTRSAAHPASRGRAEAATAVAQPTVAARTAAPSPARPESEAARSAARAGSEAGDRAGSTAVTPGTSVAAADRSAARAGAGVGAGTGSTAATPGTSVAAAARSAARAGSEAGDEVGSTAGVRPAAPIAPPAELSRSVARAAGGATAEGAPEVPSPEVTPADSTAVPPLAQPPVPDIAAPGAAVPAPTVAAPGAAVPAPAVAAPGASAPAAAPTQAPTPAFASPAPAATPEPEGEPASSALAPVGATAPTPAEPTALGPVSDTAEVTRMVRDKVLEVTRRVAGSGASGRFDFFAPRAALADPEATGFLTDELFGTDAHYDALVAGRPHGDEIEPAEAMSAPDAAVDDIEADRLADPVPTEQAPAAQPAPVHRGQGVRFAPSESDRARPGVPRPKPLPVDLTAHDDTEEIPRIDIRKHA